VFFAATARLLGQLGIALILGILALVVARQGDRDRRELIAVVCLAAFIVAVVGNAEPAGFDNANLPAVATIPILAALGGQMLESTPATKEPSFVRSAVYGLLVLQFAILAFAIKPQLPSAADLQGGEQIVNLLRNTPGEVLVPFHPYLALMAGKQPSAHQAMLWVLSGNFGKADRENWPRLEEDIATLLKEQSVSRIMLDRPDEVWKQVPWYYRGDKLSYPQPDAFYPVTGGQGRPNLDFVPK
jgi:hypothetical protein